jgi:hypothetical protein
MDTRDTRVSNLLFLLTAAPLGVACVITSDDTDTDVVTSSTPATTTTGAETDDPTAGTTVAPGETTETPGETTETPAETTETPADTTLGDDTTTGGVEVPESCATYGDQYLECVMDEESAAAAVADCSERLMMYEAYGPDCLAAAEDVYACLSALTCEEFVDVKVSAMACMKQNMALETACFKK